AGHYWVPMDDHNCMSWNWIYTFGDPQPGELEGQLGEEGTSLDYLNAEQNFRKRINRDTRWGINRQAQRDETYTGIEGINTQDHAVQESMGPISNRSREHLGPSDKTIIALRQVLLRAVHTVEDGGDPPGVSPVRPTSRGIEKILPAGAEWRADL